MKMEIMEVKAKSQKEYNFSFSNKDIINLKSCQKYNLSNSLKLKNTQSFSTGIDDIKENEIKDSISMKNLKFFKSFSFYNDDTNLNKQSLNRTKKEALSNCNGIKEQKNTSNNENVLNIDGNLNNYVNSSLNNSLLLTKNVNNICLENNKKLPHNINNINDINNINKNNEIEKNEKNQLVEETNMKKNKNIEHKIKILKVIPPQKPYLYEAKYLLSTNNDNNINNNDSPNINHSHVHNAFFNHLMIHNNKIKNENSSYFSICTTNRNRGKILTILYCHPIRKRCNDNV